MLSTTLDAMILPTSDASIPATNNSTKRADEFCKEVEDVYMTIKNFQQSELLVIENPDTLTKMESLEKEKQISVDPISLKESSMSVVSPRLVLRPVVTNQKVASMHPPLPLVPAKPKFISASLPNSATSSPRFGSNLLKKKWRNQSPASPHQMDSPGRQHSPVHSLLGLRQDSNLQRSKSCGEGRASSISDEFDLCLSKMNGTEHDHRHHDSFSKSAVNKDGEKGINKMDHIPEEEFKCGALCLFLPAFGKGKPVRPQKEGVEVQTVISRTVSLERFECGSWSSSAIINDNEDDGDSVNLYFDLPLELIRTSVNDAHSPVTTAFVFDKDRKGVLKNGSARATASKSHESGRHVRFSTSSPASHPTSPTSCITPRLRKAREEFNAFLEAQSA